MTTATAGAASQGDTGHRPGSSYWKTALAPYARPHLGRSTLDLATSVVPYLILMVVMYLTLDVSYLITLALALPAAGFLLRTYIVFHDCTHGSFLDSKRANAILGSTLGLLVYTPFLSWRHSHAIHHATSGDLDRRGQGDVPMLTLSEYYGKDFRGRLGYRLIRNPIVMFGLGPVWSMLIQTRLVRRSQRPRIRRAIIATNVALAIVIAGLCALIGWQALLALQLPMVLLAGGTGVWLFYVQHQFEDAYWETGGDWTYADAALRGSSYLVLPKVLQFFTGNIGLHHVHHLSSRIPNYNLQRAHDDNPIFHDVPRITLWDGIKAVRLKLLDEEDGQLVTWRQARERAARARAAA
jgi:omega-6 fatty acid desaturase (delta-12 desaturase)